MSALRQFRRAIFLVSVVCVLAAGSYLAVAWLTNTTVELSLELDKWGQVGDYIGGVSAPLLGLLSVWGVFLLLVQQEHVLEEQRMLLEGQREFFETQHFQVLFVSALDRFLSSRDALKTKIAEEHRARFDSQKEVFGAVAVEAGATVLVRKQRQFHEEIQEAVTDKQLSDIASKFINAVGRDCDLGPYSIQWASYRDAYFALVKLCQVYCPKDRKAIYFDQMKNYLTIDDDCVLAYMGMLHPEWDDLVSFCISQGVLQSFSSDSLKPLLTDLKVIARGNWVRDKLNNVHSKS